MPEEEVHKTTSRTNHFLDIIYREKNLIGFMGDIGSGKTLLSHILLHNSLKNHRPVIYICCDIFPDDLRDILSRKGIDVEKYEKLGYLRIVDAYTWKAPELEATYDISIVNIGSIVSFIEKEINNIKNKTGKKPDFIIFEEFTSIIDYNSFDAGTKLINVMKKFNDKWNISIILILSSYFDDIQKNRLSNVIPIIIYFDKVDNEPYIVCAKKKRTTIIKEKISLKEITETTTNDIFKSKTVFFQPEKRELMVSPDIILRKKVSHWKKASHLIKKVNEVKPILDPNNQKCIYNQLDNLLQKRKKNEFKTEEDFTEELKRIIEKRKIEILSTVLRELKNGIRSGHNYIGAEKQLYIHIWNALIEFSSEFL